MSPIKTILEWIKDKPEWWQHSVRLSLINGEHSHQHLREIYNLAQIEHGILKNDELKKYFGSKIDDNGFEDELNEITLKKIENVVNVGSLAENQTLSFSKKGLNIIYGENGAGKSSYSRILKHACLSRGGTPDILGNVFEDSQDVSSANITINIDNSTDLKEWDKNFRSDSSTKSIRVFDSTAAEHFISKEDELGYKPSGIDILENLADAVDFVNRNISEEIMPGNGFHSLPTFSNTKTGDFINSLSAESKTSEFPKYTITQEEIGKTSLIRKEIDDLRSKSPQQIKREISNKVKQLEPLRDFIKQSIEKLNDDVYKSIKEAEEDYEIKKNAADNLKEETLPDLPIKEVGGEQWKIMWNSAEKYVKSIEPKLEFPPKEKSICPLCIQEVGHLSSQRMLGFYEYVKSDAITLATKSKDYLDRERNKIINYIHNYEAYNAAIDIAGESIVNFRNKLEVLIQTLEARKTIFSSKQLPEKLNSIDDSLLNDIEALIKSLNVSIASISDNDNSALVIKGKEDELLELNDKKLFSENIEKIKSNILRYQLIAKLEKIKKQCNSRPITNKNTEIFKEEVILPLIDSFNNEIGKFGFNRFNVSPKTRGKSGAQLLKLEIQDGNEPLLSKVASEGEQRCISIACFLAEMQADKRKSAVIFDDPVNSLSHQWSQRVAKRIVDESKERQIVVFTHDIVFYKLLLEEAESTDGTTVNEICLERSRRRSGIVRTTPPWDALTTSRRVKYLQTRLRELRKIDQNGTEQEFRREAHYFYGYLREAWERLVEEKLLNQVVTRFGRSIQTQRLKRLVDDIKQSDYDKIDSAMGRCSTYFRGHDSAPAVGDPYPTIEEIEHDLTNLSDFTTELQDKRKRN